MAATERGEPKVNDVSLKVDHGFCASIFLDGAISVGVKQTVRLICDVSMKR